VRRALILVVLAACAACDHDSSAEARMFLDRVGQIDLDTPIAERRRLVDSLASLPLTDDEVSAARDLCVNAHRSILEAEQHQADAVALVALHGDDLPPEVELQVGNDIEQSGRALERSRDLFSRCISEQHAIDARYGRRRR